MERKLTTITEVKYNPKWTQFDCTFSLPQWGKHSGNLIDLTCFNLLDGAMDLKIQLINKKGEGGGDIIVGLKLSTTEIQPFDIISFQCYRVEGDRELELYSKNRLVITKDEPVKIESALKIQRSEAAELQVEDSSAISELKLKFRGTIGTVSYEKLNQTKKCPKD